jgi:hypothetical protein
LFRLHTILPVIWLSIFLAVFNDPFVRCEGYGTARVWWKLLNVKTAKWNLVHADYYNTQQNEIF